MAEQRQFTFIEYEKLTEKSPVVDKGPYTWRRKFAKQPGNFNSTPILNSFYLPPTFSMDFEQDIRKLEEEEFLIMCQLLLMNNAPYQPLQFMK